MQFSSSAVKKALLLAFSAWLAFLIAVSLDIPNPYWAAMPVWVIAQSTRGLLLERALYRVIGTVVGAATGLIILVLFPPFWQLVLMALMVFIFAGALYLLQQTRAYMALLAGITVAVVMLPALSAPDQAFELAWARTVCTLIGVIVGTLVTGWGTPSHSRHDFYQQVRRLASDAVKATIVLLSESDQHKADQILARLTSQISSLEAQAANAAAGSVQGHKRTEYVEALLFATLETLAAASQLHAQLQRGMQISPEVIAQLHDFSDRFEQGRPLAPLRRQDAELLPNKVSLARLRRALGQMKRAELALFATNYPFWRGGVLLRRFVADRDWIRARQVATVAGLVAFISGWVVYITQSEVIELAATGVCIFSLLLSSLPRPHLVARMVMKGVAVGVIVAVFYRVGIQPYVQEPVWLLVSVLPFMLMGGFARNHPVTMQPALDATMCFLLVSQMGMPVAPLVIVLQGAAAMWCGVALVCTSFYLLPRHTEQWAQALLRVVVYDLYDLIRQRPPRQVSLWRARVTRHLLQLLRWMGTGTPQGLLALVNFGYGVIAWQRLTAKGSAHESIGLQLLSALVAFDREPEKSHQAILALVPQITDAVLVAALYDMADALEDAKPMLQLLHSSPVN